MAHQLTGCRIAFMIANEGAEQIELTEPWEESRTSPGTASSSRPSLAAHKPSTTWTRPRLSP
jgi:hypothetical protein